MSRASAGSSTNRFETSVLFFSVHRPLNLAPFFIGLHATLWAACRLPAVAVPLHLAKNEIAHVVVWRECSMITAIFKPLVCKKTARMRIEVSSQQVISLLCLQCCSRKRSTGRHPSGRCPFRRSSAPVWCVRTPEAASQKWELQFHCGCLLVSVSRGSSNCWCGSRREPSPL